MVGQLLSLGVSPDIRGSDCPRSAHLHEAARNNNTEVAQLLITHKADIEARDKYNQTPLDVAGNSYRNTKSVICLLMKHTANTS